jgi:hypothetical protein
LKDNTLDIQRHAVDALRILGEVIPQAIDALLKCALNADDYDIRSGAVYALGALGKITPEVIDALLKCALKDKHWYVRSSAVYVLGTLGKVTPEVINALLECALKDEHWYVRGSAAYALGMLVKEAPEIINTLVSNLWDKETSVPIPAMEALVQISQKNPLVLKTIQSMLGGNDVNLKKSALFALANPEFHLNFFVYELREKFQPFLQTVALQEAIQGVTPLGAELASIVTAYMLNVEQVSIVAAYLREKAEVKSSTVNIASSSQKSTATVPVTIPINPLVQQIPSLVGNALAISEACHNLITTASVTISSSSSASSMQPNHASSSVMLSNSLASFFAPSSFATVSASAANSSVSAQSSLSNSDSVSNSIQYDAIFNRYYQQFEATGMYSASTTITSLAKAAADEEYNNILGKM